MRFGEKLGVRWDFAFYQMIVETGALSYWRGNRAGDVKPDAEQFRRPRRHRQAASAARASRTSRSGVRAHLEHLLLYAGRPVENPVAERTRKVQEWGVLTPWQKTFKRPITFTDLAAKWAPGTSATPAMLQTVADRFHAEVCAQARPAARSWCRRPARRRPRRRRASWPRPQPRAGADRRGGVGAARHRAGQGRRQRPAFRARAPRPPSATVLPPASPSPFKVLNAPPPPEAPARPPSPCALVPPARRFARQGSVGADVATGRRLATATDAAQGQRRRTRPPACARHPPPAAAAKAKPLSQKPPRRRPPIRSAASGRPATADRKPSSSAR